MCQCLQYIRYVCLGLRSWEHFDDKKSHFSSMFNILVKCVLYAYMLSLYVIYYFEYKTFGIYQYIKKVIVSF